MITRRAFVKTAAGCIAAGAALPLHALAPLNIGISAISYQQLSLTDMVAQLKILLPTNGLNNQEVEMSRAEFSVASHPSEEAVLAMKKQLSDAGIRCRSYYSGTLTSEKDIADAVRFAKIFGAKNISGDATDVALLKKTDQAASDAGLTFGLHNSFSGGRTGWSSAEEVLKALDGLSESCGVTADTGNFAASGHDPVEAIRLLGPKLKVVHLKDVKAAGSTENVLLGSGIAKIEAVEEELHRQNFRRMIAVEYEAKSNSLIEDMQKNVGFAWKYGFSGA